MDSSTLTDANLTGAVVTGTDFMDTTSLGFTAAQLYSTQSYQGKALSGIGLGVNDLTGWDFREQNLSNADLVLSSLTNANLTGVSLRNAHLVDATGLTSAKFSPGSVYSRWTLFPSDFDPVAAGLTLVLSPAGDLNADDALSEVDVDMIASKIGGRPIHTYWLPDAAFDLNGDGSISLEDHRVWVKDLKHTWYGDANLDGQFNSSDMVQVFQSASYEQEPTLDQWGRLVNSAGWSAGDWNGDGIFDSADFITAFQDGGYDQGPRTDLAAVPEPSGTLLLVMGLPLWVNSRRTRRAV